ncbi:hypothetical protein GYMLUDRAFT_923629 [Collybiopsis luxurians FD-317 M1]|uniref:Uncharacterized protein n=1 Tax=Collybiopsis luxurians FD-317 M1 TaxID=944289 RepID=A0A0D0CFV4_9AGAR|nr:hypothetical protein GYMLUDRAFT_923629 [Collybiopsis luxurians FD-317 M1]
MTRFPTKPERVLRSYPIVSLPPEPTQSKLQYELPPLIVSIQHNWISTVKAGRIVSVVLFLGSLLQLSIVKDPESFSPASSRGSDADSKIQVALLVLNYVALLLHLSGIFTSFILIDHIEELPMSAARKSMIEEGNLSSNSTRILQRYGLHRSWNRMVGHWFVTILIALMSSVASIILFIWAYEPLPVQIVITCVTTLIIFSIIGICIF